MDVVSKADLEDRTISETNELVCVHLSDPMVAISGAVRSKDEAT